MSEHRVQSEQRFCGQAAALATIDFGRCCCENDAVVFTTDFGETKCLNRAVCCGMLIGSAKNGASGQPAGSGFKIAGSIPAPIQQQELKTLFSITNSHDFLSSNDSSATLLFFLP